MTNDQFLIVSYFTIAVISAALGLFVYAYLRRSFGSFVDSGGTSRLAIILKRLFPFGLVFPALLGFLSVSYYSCDVDTYGKIVRSRKYLLEKNQQQLSCTLFSLVVAILLWDLVLVFIQKYAQRRGKAS